MAQRFVEQAQIASMIKPVDLSTAANSGDWIDCKDYGRVVCVVYKGKGTAGDDITLTAAQATDVSGTGTKALTCDFWSKQGADLEAVASFTKGTAAATWTNLTNAEQELLLVAEVDVEDMDVSGGFVFVNFSIADVGTNAQLGAAIIILLDPAYPQATLPTVVA